MIWIGISLTAADWALLKMAPFVLAPAVYVLVQAVRGMRAIGITWRDVVEELL